jgi:hypothetical protein
LCGCCWWRQRNWKARWSFIWDKKVENEQQKKKKAKLICGADDGWEVCCGVVAVVGDCGDPGRVKDNDEAGVVTFGWLEWSDETVVDASDWVVVPVGCGVVCAVSGCVVSMLEKADSGRVVSGLLVSTIEVVSTFEGKIVELSMLEETGVEEGIFWVVFGGVVGKVSLPVDNGRVVVEAPPLMADGSKVDWGISDAAETFEDGLDVSVAVESADGEARGNDVLVGAFCDDKESSVKGKVVEAKVFVGVFNGEETGFWVVTAEADDSVVWLADSDPAFGCVVDSSEASVDGELFWVVSGELEVPTVWEGVADANVAELIEGSAEMDGTIVGGSIWGAEEDAWDVSVERVEVDCGGSLVGKSMIVASKVVVCGGSLNSGVEFGCVDGEESTAVELWCVGSDETSLDVVGSAVVEKEPEVVDDDEDWGRALETRFWVVWEEFVALEEVDEGNDVVEFGWELVGTTKDDVECCWVVVWLDGKETRLGAVVAGGWVVWLEGEGTMAWVVVVGNTQGNVHPQTKSKICFPRCGPW